MSDPLPTVFDDTTPEPSITTLSAQDNAVSHPATFVAKREPSDRSDPSDQMSPAADFATPPAWQGREIEPFSFGRQSLARRLMQCSVPIPPASYGNDLDAHILDAAIVLYLCTHPPDAFRHLRGDASLFIETIEAWAEEHLPRPLWPQAILFVFQLWERCRRSEVIAPQGIGSKSGNA